MTGGRWHAHITLPGGQRVTADYRDPIAAVIQRAWAQPETSDLLAILNWYQRHIQTVAACQRGECDHEC